MTQKGLGLSGIKNNESRGVNLFSASKTSVNSWALGKLDMTYRGNNQFSITRNKFDFDYQSNFSFGRNAGTFIGGAILGQFYNTPVIPYSILRNTTGFGGAFWINFNGTVTIPNE